MKKGGELVQFVRRNEPLHFDCVISYTKENALCAWF